MNNEREYTGISCALYKCHFSQLLAMNLYFYSSTFRFSSIHILSIILSFFFPFCHLIFYFISLPLIFLPQSSPFHFSFSFSFFSSSHPQSSSSFPLKNLFALFLSLFFSWFFPSPTTYFFSLPLHFLLLFLSLEYDEVWILWLSSDQPTAVRAHYKE